MIFDISFSCKFFTSLDFTVDVPDCLFQVFNGVVLEVGAPDVLDSVAKAKVHVLGYVYALNVAGVSHVVRWVVYWVVHQSVPPKFSLFKSLRWMSSIAW
jgi:hypothetical protein